MLFLGISLVATHDLPPNFFEIALVLTGGKPPKYVWAVICDGKIVAIYTSPEHAFDRMMLVKHGIEISQSPVVQTKAEAELLWDLSQSKGSEAGAGKTPSAITPQEFEFK